MNYESPLSEVIYLTQEKSILSAKGDQVEPTSERVEYEEL